MIRNCVQIELLLPHQPLSYEKGVHDHHMGTCSMIEDTQSQRNEKLTLQSKIESSKIPPNLFIDIYVSPILLQTVF